MRGRVTVLLGLGRSRRREFLGRGCSCVFEVLVDLAFLNSRMPLPRDFPSSGSFFGPKTRSAITKIINISEKPSEPINPPKTGVYINNFPVRRGTFFGDYGRPEPSESLVSICYNEPIVQRKGDD